MNFIKPLKFAAIPLASLCLAPLACFAQGNQGELVEVVTVVAKPGMSAKVEQGIKQVNAYAQSHGDTTGTSAFEVMFGPNEGNIIILIPFKWESVDNPPSYEAGLDATIEKVIDPYVVSAHSTLVRQMPKLGNPGSGNAPEKYYEVLELRTRPGRSADFMAGVTQLSAAEQKFNQQPNPVLIYEEVAGGNADDIVVAIGHPTFADFGTPGKSNTEVLTAAYGGAAARSIIDTLENSIASEENYIVAYRPDLSLTPAGQGK